MDQLTRHELVTDREVDAAYLYLKGHPRRGKDSAGCVSNTVSLDHLIPGYRGPDINLDFDRDGVLIGIEIVG